MTALQAAAGSVAGAAKEEFASCPVVDCQPAKSAAVPRLGVGTTKFPAPLLAEFHQVLLFEVRVVTKEENVTHLVLGQGSQPRWMCSLMNQF